jgi:hypothetical protein
MSVGKTHRVSSSAGNVTMACRTAFTVGLKLTFVVLIVAVIGGVAAAQSVSLSEATTRQSWAGCENWLNVSAASRFGCVDAYMNRKEATTVEGFRKSKRARPAFALPASARQQHSRATANTLVARPGRPPSRLRRFGAQGLGTAGDERERVAALPDGLPVATHA